MIHLCYKKYGWKVTEGACKSFLDKTGLDLHTVFGDYVNTALKVRGENQISMMQAYSKLYTRDIASKALHAIIGSINDEVELREIEDGTHRVSWYLNNRPDDLSESWPFVMTKTAFDIDDYFNANMPKKKADGSEG